MTKGEVAKEYFEKGANCSQAVALAFSKELNMPIEQIKKLLIGFGGGFGRQRLVCGAVSGLTFVLSALLSDGEDRLPIYSVIQEACAIIKNELGSIICADLLKGSTTITFDNPKPDERTPEYYKKRPCGEIVKFVADVTQGMIDKYGK